MAQSTATRRGTGRGPGAVLAVVLVVTALVVIGVLAGRWWTSPTVFRDRGDSFTADPVPLSEAALSMAVTFPSRDDQNRVVTFRDARAHFAVNSAAARATFSICTPGRRDDLIGVVKAGDLPEFCSRVRPLVPGARMAQTSDAHGDYVVMTLRPRRPGRLTVDRVDLDYALGWERLHQQGTQPVGLAVTLTAR